MSAEVHCGEHGSGWWTFTAGRPPADFHVCGIHWAGLEGWGHSWEPSKHDPKNTQVCKECGSSRHRAPAPKGEFSNRRKS